MLTSTSPNSYPWHHIVGVNFCVQVKLLAQMKWLDILAISIEMEKKGWMGSTKNETKAELLEDCNMAAPYQIEDSAIYIHGLYVVLLNYDWLAETHDTKY